MRDLVRAKIDPSEARELVIRLTLSSSIEAKKIKTLARTSLKPQPTWHNGLFLGDMML